MLTYSHTEKGEILHLYTARPSLYRHNSQTEEEMYGLSLPLWRHCQASGHLTHGRTGIIAHSPESVFRLPFLTDLLSHHLLKVALLYT